jgi:hypothetical protein
MEKRAGCVTISGPMCIDGTCGRHRNCTILHLNTETCEYESTVVPDVLTASCVECFGQCTWPVECPMVTV